MASADYQILKALGTRQGHCSEFFLTDDQFNTIDGGKTGTHSMRQFATTQAWEGGCSKDDTDSRAKWKGHSINSIPLMMVKRGRIA